MSISGFPHRSAFLIALILTFVFSGPGDMWAQGTSAPKQQVKRKPTAVIPIGPIGPGNIIQQTIEGKDDQEIYEIRVVLGANQFSRLEVEQQKIDAVLDVYIGDQYQGKIDSFSGTLGKEILLLLAKTPTDFRIHIRTDRTQPIPGSVRITVKEQREAQPGDDLLIEGQRAYMEGVELFGRGAIPSAALGTYQKAVDCWHQAGDRELELRALNLLGSAALNMGKLDKAGSAHQQTLDLAQSLPDRIWAAAAVRGIADTLLRDAQLRPGVDKYQEYLELIRALNDRQSEATALTKMGKVYESLGDYKQALAIYQRALPICEEFSYLRIQVSTLSKMGDVYFAIGEYQEALNRFTQSLKLSQQVKDGRSEAETLDTIGKVHAALGDEQQAMQYLNHSLEIARTVGDKPLVVQALTDIGQCLNTSGRYSEAQTRLQEALTISYDRNIRQALPQVLGKLGVALAAQRQYDEALRKFTTAYELSHTHGDQQEEVIALSHLADLHAKMGEMKRAAETIEKGYALSRKIGDRWNEAHALYQWAEVLSQTRNFLSAIEKIKAAVEIVEVLRTKFGNRDMRAAYFGTVQAYYQLYIDTLMQMSQQHGDAYMVEALNVNERARARSLLDLLNESRVEIRQGVDAALVQSRVELQNKLNIKSEKLRDLLLRDTDKVSIGLLREEIFSLDNEYHGIQAKIREKSPVYAALTQPEPLKLADVQQQVLDENTLLLEYSLGEKQSYLWLVSQTGMKGYRLPGRETLEREADQLRRLISRRPPVNEAERAAAHIEYIRAATLLSEHLLSPVADQLRGQRLLIVSDGALQYIPFAALASLPDASEQGQAAQGFTPLMMHHEIVGLPSATTLAILRRELAQRRVAPMELAVLADPVFGKYDPRVADAQARLAPQPASKRPGRRVGGTRGDILTERGEELVIEDDQPAQTSQLVAALITDRKSDSPAETSEAPRPTIKEPARNRVLPRLIYSREEADAILRLAPKGSTLRATDFRASRDMAISPVLRDYRILHFATHGIFDEQHPELSGLVFSTVDDHGNRLTNSTVSIREIYNMSLSAELVVLSACQSAVGKAVQGEGFLGLTRGFMYAGSRRVVATLWSVNDAATAELMKRFYQQIFGGRRLSSAAALRKAQMEMWQQTRWQAPYYWASFVLQGEYTK